MRELELLFIFLSKRKDPRKTEKIAFRHLLVAQFNLLDRFIELIGREIENAREGRPAAITIKLNNLEEEVLIGKLYEASQAGVRIQLIVRSICCCIPGVAGMSENITIRRIVGRYLEHGRVFIFHNNGDEEIFLGSADWMDRNIYRRIEVCFPVSEPALKEEIRNIIRLQLEDNSAATPIDSHSEEVAIDPEFPGSTAAGPNSQEAIYQYLSGLRANQ
ncbi:hypothetical protein ACQ86N_11555 [Puia sp. P3]|uniref:hypothetical protein n=1 Tax=Puia sp. P3 TaxID=3423952 RepID=UPI003D66BE7B